MTKLDRRSFAFIPLRDENQPALTGPAMDGFAQEVVYQVTLQISAKRRVQAETVLTQPFFSHASAQRNTTSEPSLHVATPALADEEMQTPVHAGLQ